MNIKEKINKIKSIIPITNELKMIEMKNSDNKAFELYSLRIKELKKMFKKYNELQNFLKDLDLDLIVETRNKLYNILYAINELITYNISLFNYCMLLKEKLEQDFSELLQTPNDLLIAENTLAINLSIEELISTIKDQKINLIKELNLPEPNTDIKLRRKNSIEKYQKVLDTKLKLKTNPCTVTELKIKTFRPEEEIEQERDKLENLFVKSINSKDETAGQKFKVIKSCPSGIHFKITNSKKDIQGGNLDNEIKILKSSNYSNTQKLQLILNKIKKHIDIDTSEILESNDSCEQYFEAFEKIIKYEKTNDINLKIDVEKILKGRLYYCDQVNKGILNTVFTDESAGNKTKKCLTTFQDCNCEMCNIKLTPDYSYIAKFKNPFQISNNFYEYYFTSISKFYSSNPHVNEIDFDSFKNKIRNPVSFIDLYNVNNYTKDFIAGISRPPIKTPTVKPTTKSSSSSKSKPTTKSSSSSKSSSTNKSGKSNKTNKKKYSKGKSTKGKWYDRLFKTEKHLTRVSDLLVTVPTIVNIENPPTEFTNDSVIYNDRLLQLEKDPVYNTVYKPYKGNDFSTTETNKDLVELQPRLFTPTDTEEYEKVKIKILEEFEKDSKAGCPDEFIDEDLIELFLFVKIFSVIIVSVLEKEIYLDNNSLEKIIKFNNTLSLYDFESLHEYIEQNFINRQVQNNLDEIINLLLDQSPQNISEGNVIKIKYAISRTNSSCQLENFISDIIKFFKSDITFEKCNTCNKFIFKFQKPFRTVIEPEIKEPEIKEIKIIKCGENDIGVPPEKDLAAGMYPENVDEFIIKDQHKEQEQLNDNFWESVFIPEKSFWGCKNSRITYQTILELEEHYIKGNENGFMKIIDNPYMKNGILQARNASMYTSPGTYIATNRYNLYAKNVASDNGIINDLINNGLLPSKGDKDPFVFDSMPEKHFIEFQKQEMTDVRKVLKS